MAPPIHCWMGYQANQWIHQRNIHLVSDSTTKTILDGLSGSPMDTPNEYSYHIYPLVRTTIRQLQWLSAWPMDTLSRYSVGIRLIQQHHPHNIWPIRLINGYTEWIFRWYPPNPTGPSKWYWIACQADVQVLNHLYLFPSSKHTP